MKYPLCSCVITIRVWVQFLIVFLLSTPAVSAELDPGLAIIAGPVHFNAILIDESTVEFSWNPELLDGSDPLYFNLWDGQTLLAQTIEHRWQLGGIDRNSTYDFSVSAVTASGPETRRSSRIFYDLPPLDQSQPDEFNAYLPPLENLKAERIDGDSVTLTWDLPGAHWSYAAPSDYWYSITIGGHEVAREFSTSHTLTGLADHTLVWIAVSPTIPAQLSSRQPNLVLVDMSQPVGTVTRGYPGFNSLFGLRTEVYSSTAAELFWESSQRPNVAHVYLNGRLIERQSEIYSLFLDHLEPGTRTLVSVGHGWPFDEDPPTRLLQHDYPLMHTWIETPPDPWAAPDTVKPVTGLRVDVYSSTAAEVFWDRSTVALATYRIYLDSEFLTDTDGTSWFLDALPPATHSEVAVATLAPDAMETPSRSVQFTTPDHHIGPSADCSVNGLRAEVYSTTAAEVFWERNPSTPEFNLWLDGHFHVRTDAVSWYFGNFDPGTAHELTVEVADVTCEGNGHSVSFDLDGNSVPGDDVNPLVTPQLQRASI